MLVEQIEWKWIEAFTRALELCRLQRGDHVAILSETQSRAVNVRLSELALLRLGAKPFHVVIPTPPLAAPVPVRSSGASPVIQNAPPVIGALAASNLIVDCTVEGILHAPELSEILSKGSRLFMISNEHPETLERLLPSPELEPKVKAAVKILKSGRTMRVTSTSGTNLTVDLQEAAVGGIWGYVDRAGKVGHWPGGLCLAYPRSGAVNGRLVLERGDLNLTFKRYLESPVELTLVEDFVESIDGKGTDADLMREYWAAWKDRNAYAVSHVGWGMNPLARWEALTAYDKRDTNGVEQRAFAGNFLFSTGANETARRFTLGHFDLPMRNCTVSVDDLCVVRDGQLQGELL